MGNLIKQAVRAIGIIITVLAIPFSVILVFGLQGVGSEPEWVTAVRIASILINLVAVPFILIGFILRYDIKSAFYLALLHFTLWLTEIGILIANVTPGNVAIPLIVSLPAALYILGYLLNRR